MIMHKLSSQVVCDYNDPVAETKYGKIRGVKIDSTYIFRGVKYADAKRFHFPTEPESWEGVKEALNYGYCCPEINTPVPHDAYNVPHFWYPQDEDCQYLNIWTQSLDKNAKKPVMVWMHGGGWFSGSSVEIYSYDGENLSIFGDVVVVSLNHRLNVLGFLDLSAYGEEYKNSANCGLADLVAALKWIHDNIENFGGDPDNVLIMGQSGGGSKVLSMLQTPAADGLFHRAVMQSGGAGSSGIDPDYKKKAQRMAELVLKYAGIEPENVKELENIHWYDLAEATAQAQWVINQEGNFSWGPQYDGEYFFGNPLDYGWREESKHIPMLGGSVLGEFSNNFDVFLAEGSKNHWSDEEKDVLMKKWYGDKADAILDAFKKAYPTRNTADALYVDTRLRKGFLELVKSRASVEGAAPIYNWMFNLESPWMNGTMAWHNAEEPYMFHNAEYIETAYIPGVSERLQDQMAGAWVAFAYTGNPNHALLPQWDAVTPDKVPTMLFDVVTEQVVDHDKELMALLPDASKGFPGSKIMKAIFGVEPEIKY